jgi:hypothetical protein
MSRPQPSIARFRLATLVAAAVVAAAPSVATAQPPARERVVNIVMEDQFRNRRETSVMRNDVVVLVYAERRGSEAGQALGRRLHVHFHPTAEQVPATEWGRQPVVGMAGWPAGVRVPDVHVVAVACLPEVPKALHPVARAQTRKDSPFVPVWLDFAGTMESTFGLAAGEPNVALIDTQGRVHGVLSGRFDELKFRDLVATIDQLRQQARPDLRTAAVPVNAVR